MSTQERDQWAAVADRFWTALDRGNVEEVMACCLPSLQTWHNFDRKSMNAEEARAAHHAFIGGTAERATTKVQRDFLHDGIVQRHVLIVRMKSDGPQRAWPVCVLMRFREGKISSITEYIDRAGSFDPVTG